ncbi:MAG: polyprenol monophosphomannose synthase [Acidobacteria bacterium]|nr:polyprenol monophosphomannose synthase [Acidobacteriota bacterium]
MVTAVLNPPKLGSAQAVDPAIKPLAVYGGQKTALIIPTLREAANIPVLLNRIRAVLDPAGVNYEILIVDDDSRDGTEEVVAEISKKDPRVQLLVRKGKRGLSGAVLHGWMHTDAPLIGVMDADLQHPPELLPELISTMLGGCDLVIGSRYTEGGGLGSWNPIRKLISAAAVWVTWPIQRTGLRAKDPMSGFFFVRRDCLNGVDFQEEGFKLLLEILVRARLTSVHEVPFAFGQRFRGASKANMKVAVDYGKLLARLYSCRFGFKRPVPVSSV